MAKMFSLITLILVASVSDVFTKKHPTVVVLSFDGFKSEYIDKKYTPTLFELKKKSAGPKYMKSVFPTKSFVTHFTLSTGVYPDVHGVYGNTMFDTNGQKIFNTEQQFQTNKKIVPIWIENEKADESRHSGVMMWPGSEFSYGGIKPTYIMTYNEYINWNIRANKIVEWMINDKQKANLVMAYFENTIKDVKKTQHEKNLKDYTAKVDDTINTIYTKLMNANLPNGFDIIVMSDHGTKQVTEGGIMFIEDFVENSPNINYILSGPIIFIKAEDENIYKHIIKRLKSKSSYKRRFYFYTNTSFEDDWHLNNISSMHWVITLVATSGNTFYEKDVYNKLTKDTYFAGEFLLEENGYDNKLNDMNAVFLGMGPHFKESYTTFNYFNLIDVYPLLKALLKMPDNASDVQTRTSMSDNVKDILELNNL